MNPTVITGLSARDIRFPTSIEGHGSDASNNPDYSCAYVVVQTNSGLEGYGHTFTAGRGTELVVMAAKAYSPFVVGRKLDDIFNNFSSFWVEITQEPQMRWLGPEKGVAHLAISAIMNALWDLWARMEAKPIWKLLVDMEPEKLVSCMVFTYITDVLTKGEAIEMLKKGQDGKEKRVEELKKIGYPAYTMSVGWRRYSDDKIKENVKIALAEGFTRFKVKVGSNWDDDNRRLAMVREQIGPDKVLYTDANQKWDVNTAIEWMKPLAKYNITWIEEPTSPDDILGHAKIRKALKPHGIGVATGEGAQNRVIFKQLLEAEAFDFCQIDACRLGGLNEILPIVLMAHKFGVPVCPHAGGVGLCELVQHIQIFDYAAVSKSLDNRVIEYATHLHEHFVHPVMMVKDRYQVPVAPGYSSEMKKESLAAYEYPDGHEWQKLFAEGKFKRPE